MRMIKSLSLSRLSRKPSRAAPGPNVMLIYLHGFNSSSASIKANQLRLRLAALGLEKWFAAPDLSHWPHQALATLEAIVNLYPIEDVTLSGSSLDGYYATGLVEKHGVKAVLVNPGPRPYELLRPVLGAQRNLCSGEAYDFNLERILQFAGLHEARLA